VARSCDRSNESSDYIKGAEFLDQLIDSSFSEGTFCSMECVICFKVLLNVTCKPEHYVRYAPIT
jgi:hypothetical protein